MEEEIKLQFIDKGTHIEMKQDTPVVKFNAKQVVEQIDSLRAKIGETVSKCEMAKTQIVKMEEGIEINKNRLKDLEKYEAKFTEAQRSRMKSIFKDIQKEVAEQIANTYKWDKVLTDDQNRRQMFSFFQRGIATHARVKEEIANRIWSDMCMKDCFFDNPFEGFNPK